jgi:hypothetical protein
MSACEGGIELEIAAHEVIGTFMSACIDFGCGCIDQWAIVVKGLQGTILIEGHAGLNSAQRILCHEKRSFHRAIISPEPNSPPCGVVTAATIWKAQGHRITSILSEPPACAHLRIQQALHRRRQDGITAILISLQQSRNANTDTPAKPACRPLEAHASTRRHRRRRSILVWDFSHHRFGGDEQTSDRCCAL